MAAELGAGKGRGRARGRANCKPLAEVLRAVPGQSSAASQLSGIQQGRGDGANISTLSREMKQMSVSATASRADSSVWSARSRVTTVTLPTASGADASDASGAALGRGATRGRREVEQTVRTKPSAVNSKRGTSGRQVMLTSNYFKLESHTDWCLYQYRVDFAPEEDMTMIRKRLIRNHKDTLGGYIFDGTVMYTSHRLHPEPMELFSQRQADGENIRISIRLVSDLAEGDSHYIQVFNILMRMSLDSLKLQLVGRNFFDAAAKITEIDVKQYKLELWPGYVTSIRQHENDIMMCAEITHKVMRQDTVLDSLNDAIRNNPRDYREAFKASIIGGVVLTDYNNHTYRIDDVDFSVSPRSTFAKRTGEEISYGEYYRTRYGLNIAQQDQPLLISRTKPRERRAGQSELVFLVPELCRCTGLTDEMRGNFQLMRAVADHTRVAPDQRIDKLNKFNQRLMSSQEIIDLYKQWNLKLATDLIKFNARILPEEKILAGNGARYMAGPQTDWTRELRMSCMLTNGKLENWVVIAPNRCMRDAQGFTEKLAQSGNGMRFQIPKPYFHEIPDDRAGTYVEALEQVISSQNPQLIMCVVTNNRADRYAAIKKKCCVDRPVPTQVMLAKNINAKGVMSIATKVAIQLCCKIGGAPWTVEVPLAGLMVCGFDVCHDTASKGKSFGALVCSLDKACTRYFSAVSHHSTGEELSNDLSVNMLKALHKYKEYNQGNLPQRIVMYRDGVGEGQVPYVFNHEVVWLQENLQKAYIGSSLKMAFIIVTKRINTRLFLDNRNPPPGTVADDVITMPEKYDFYLVSQSVRQGTVSPTSYNIIFDTVGLDIDKLQRLTYKLTHLYFNWSGTVRVPAPTQYAHKLAFLVGQSLHRSPSTLMEDSLYFL